MSVLITLAVCAVVGTAFITWLAQTAQPVLNLTDEKLLSIDDVAQGKMSEGLARIEFFESSGIAASFLLHPVTAQDASRLKAAPSAPNLPAGRGPVIHPDRTVMVIGNTSMPQSGIHYLTITSDRRIFGIR